ncbi:hypothetical protein TSAR_003951 [Trichomalopsis sarcophagae]|uniref:Uncharacterized protein n=1 Tax=Trichomalopsis sarcophagae TaxID=543379 RepID=A0A232EKQ4_9HYME|nr:hypothetical protein TSAR_003951 [Trichomalopsis sarcophagae]
MTVYNIWVMFFFSFNLNRETSFNNVTFGPIDAVLEQEVEIQSVQPRPPVLYNKIWVFWRKINWVHAKARSCGHCIHLIISILWPKRKKKEICFGIDEISVGPPILLR